MDYDDHCTVVIVIWDLPKCDFPPPLVGGGWEVFHALRRQRAPQRGRLAPPSRAAATSHAAAWVAALGHPADFFHGLIHANLQQELETIWPDGFQFSCKFMLMTADHFETLIFMVSAPFQAQISPFHPIC